MSSSRFLTRRTFVGGLGATALGSLLIVELEGVAHAQGGVVVLLNARNPTPGLSRDDAYKFFFGQTAFWHGVVPVKVFVPPDASESAKAFYEPVLNTTAQAFRKHWNELQLAGRGVAPKELPVAELAQTIAKTPGGIGFAAASEAWQIAGVKGVQVK
jgi:ABC-type phosphate transport system substrate-binding protein